MIGSYVRSAQYLEVVLETAQPSEQVFAFYEEQLSAAGWQTLEYLQGFSEPIPRAQLRGFASTPISGHATSVTYCQGIAGSSLSIRSVTSPSGLTDLRLILDSRHNSPCARARHARFARMLRSGGISDLIPLLEAPAGDRQRSKGGGGHSSDYAYASALLESDMDLAQLSAHYAGQLVKAGWRSTGAGQSGPLIWQTWIFRDEDQQPWNGQFFILKAQDKERHYYLSIQVDWAHAPS